MTTKVSTSLWMKMETHTMGRDRERRQKRRSVEAKVLQKKQFRQRVIKNKKKGNDDEIQITVRTVQQYLERDDLQGEVPAHWGGDLGDTSEDTSG